MMMALAVPAVHSSWTPEVIRSSVCCPGRSDSAKSPREVPAACHSEIDGAEGTLAAKPPGGRQSNILYGSNVLKQYLSHIHFAPVHIAPAGHYDIGIRMGDTRHWLTDQNLVRSLAAARFKHPASLDHPQICLLPCACTHATPSVAARIPSL